MCSCICVCMYANKVEQTRTRARAPACASTHRSEGDIFVRFHKQQVRKRFETLSDYLKIPSPLFLNDEFSNDKHIQGSAVEQRAALEAFVNDKNVKILLLHSVGFEGGFF